MGGEMRAVRIYQPGAYQVGQSLELSHSASQHVAVVLRMRPKQDLILFCGDDREFRASIKAIQKKRVTVQIHSVKTVSRESPRVIHLAQALSKGERMSFVIQKAVELGVSSITPLLTEQSVVKLDTARLEKKAAQWEAIAVSACEQSGRNKVPVIHPISSLELYLQHCAANYKLLLHPSMEKTWRDYQFNDGEIALLIGPEGGFSANEIQQAMAAKFQPLCLGPRILRTETAALSAMTLLQAVYGDL